MKLLIITNLYPPNVVGGAEVLIENLAQYWANNNHEIYVLTADDSHKYEDNVIPDLELTAPYSKSPIVSIKRRIFVAQKNYLITKKIIKKVKPDVVLISDVKRLTVTPIQASQKLCPTVVFLHDKNAFAFLRNRSKNYFYIFFKVIDHLMGCPQKLKLNYVISNSKTTLDLQNKNLLYDFFSLVGIGLNPPKDFGNIINKTKRDFNRIAYLGGIYKDKGIHDIIKALSILINNKKHDKLYLDIAGFPNDQKYLEELKQLSIKFDIQSHVHFLGPLDNYKKYQFLASSGVFIFSSICQEGHGQTYLEAMLTNTLCVCTLAGGAKEVLKDGVNCLIYEMGNPESLANKILEIYLNKNNYSNIITNAHNLVKENYLIDTFAQKCLQSLNNAIKNYDFDNE